MPSFKIFPPRFKSQLPALDRDLHLVFIIIISSIFICLSSVGQTTVTAVSNPDRITSKLPALGRSAFIGSVYNSQSHSFTGYSIFHFNASVRSYLDKKYPQLITLQSASASSSIPMPLPLSMPTSHTEFKILTKLQDKYELMGMSPSLAVHFLSGKLSHSLIGSARFLKDEPQTSNSHFFTASLLQKTRTCEEFLHFDYNSYQNVPPVNLSHYVDWTSVKHLGEKVKGLKVVVGIEWGAKFAVNVFHPIGNGKNKEQVENTRREFSMTLYNLAFGSRSSQTSENTNDNSTKNVQVASKFLQNSKIHIFHDLEEELELDSSNQYQNQSVNFDQVREVMKKTPDVMKNVDGGKGVQILYFLYPLEQLLKIIRGQKVQEVNSQGQGQGQGQEISKDAGSLQLELFEEQNRLNQSILDLKRELEQFGASECLSDQVYQLLQQLYQKLKETTLDFKWKIRMQESDSNSIVNLEEFKSALYELNQSLESRIIKNARTKLRVFKMFRKDRRLHYLGRSLSSTKFHQKIQEDVGSRKIAYVFIYKSELAEESAENAKKSRSGKFSSGSKSKKSGSGLGYGKSLWSKNLHLFMNVLDKPHNKRFVLDCDFHPTISDCSDSNVNSTTAKIHQYRRGVLTCADCLKRINFKVKESQRIRQPAIGRFPKLGDLFNAQTELFTGTSIFKKSLNPNSNFIRVENHTIMKKNLVVIPGNSTFEEKFKAMKIFDKNLQLGIVAESIPLQNSGLFLKSGNFNSSAIFSSSSNSNSSSNKDRQIQKSLVYTVNRGKAILDLSISTSNLANSLDFFRLTDPNKNSNSGFTHFVKEVEIGHSSIISILQNSHQLLDDHDLEILKEALLKFPNVTLYDIKSLSMKTSKFLLFSDTLSSKFQELEIENFHQFLEKIGELEKLFTEESEKKSTGELTKIRPISFVLEPIETLQKPFGVITSHREYQRLQNKDEELICWSIEIFDAIQQAGRDLEGLKTAIQEHETCLELELDQSEQKSSWERLQNVQMRFEQDVDNFKKDFQKKLVHVKSKNSRKWSDLERVIEDFLKDGKFHYNFKLAALDQFESEQENIEICERELTEIE